MGGNSAEKKVAEAARATAIAHELTSDARESQMHESLVNALREVLIDDTAEGPLLIKRIPFICSDIKDIKNDLKWMKYLGGGFLIAAGGLALKALGLT